MHAVFYHDERQKKMAETSKNDYAEKSGRVVQTSIVPIREFYRAEDYHQKYALSHQLQLIKELRAIYPEINDYVDSTAVARINGYVSGHGSLEELKKELGDLGLSPEAGNALLNLVKRREQRARLMNPFRFR
jgi:peptide-methionine (S)-S-oxide reductase